MALAAARVQTTIKIDAQDSASKAIERVNKGLGRTGKEAKKVAKDTAKLDRNFSDMNDTAGQGAKDTKEGLEGVREVLGGISPELGTIATGFGGIEKLTKALPGPLGIAAAAVVGVAGGAFLLHKHLTESDAKAKSLGGKRFDEMRESLDASVDGAVALSQALDNLNNKGLTPSAELLRTIRERAEEMGLEGEDAMVAYVQAIDKGGDSLKDFEAKFGKIIKQHREVADLARAQGLDIVAIGLEKAESATVKINKNLKTQAKIQAAIDAERSVASGLRDKIEEATARDRLGLQDELAAVHGKIISLRVQDTTATEENKELAKQIKLRNEVATRQKATASEIAVLRARIAATDDADLKTIRQQELVMAQVVDIDQRRKDLKATSWGLTKAELTLERQKLDVLQLQIAAQDQARRKAEEARKKAEKAAKAAKWRARLKARAAAEKAVIDERNKQAARSIKLIEDSNARDDRISADLAQAQIDRSRSIAEARIDAAVRAGDVERADRLQGLQDIEDATNAEKAIRARFALETAKVNAESRQHAELTKQMDLEVAQVKADLEAKDAARAVARRERTRRQVQDAVSYLAQVGAAIGPLDSVMGNVAVAAAKAGPAIAKLATEGAKAAPAAIQAFGQIGSSFVDAELARVNAATQSAAEIAAAKATEAGDTEKAKEIMASAEAEMADEKEKAEKRKAGIMALVSAAQAVFMFSTGNLPGAAAAGAAAALYASIAGGAVGAVQPGGGAGTTAGTVAGGGAAGGAAGGGGGGSVINVNFQRGFVIGTEQTIGRTVQGAVRSLGTTGYAAKAGV